MNVVSTPMEKIHTSSPELKNPCALLRSMLADLSASKELTLRIFLRDLRARYRQTALGYIWILVPPLFLTASFILLREARLFSVGELPVPYALFALTGMIFWQTFAEAVQKPMQILRKSKTMLVKLHFPRESLILAGILDISFTFLIRIIVLELTLITFGIIPSISILLLPISFVGILLVGTLLGVFIAPMGLLFEDFLQALPITLSFLLICTPVAYSKVPESVLGTINTLNPLSYLIDFARGSVLGTASSPTLFLLITACSIIGTGFVWIFFRISLPHIISRLGS